MKPGIYYGMPFAEYTAIKAFSFSGAKELNKSPAHYKIWVNSNDDKDSLDRIRFRAVHLSLLEPGEYAKQVLFYEGHGATKAVKEIKAEAALSGKIALPIKDKEIIAGLTEAFLTDKYVSDRLKSAYFEVTVIWVCPDTEVLCKGRIDVLSPFGIFDIKNFSNILSDRSIAMQKSQSYYHWQIEHYRQGLCANGLQIHQDKTGIIWVELDPPFDVRVDELAPGDLEKAAQDLHDLKMIYSTCIQTDAWPKKDCPPRVIPLAYWPD